MKVPEHVAIIMDGNGRWAKKHHLPRNFGHRKGAEALRRIIKLSPSWGIRFLTLYTFSTENWKRPKKEVDYLISLFLEYVKRETPKLNKEKVRMRFIGSRKELSDTVLIGIKNSEELTKNNQKLTLTFAINYGGRAEIIDGIKNLFKKIEDGRFSLDSLDEGKFSAFLWTSDLPDPDLIIRTGGELRISNFLLYQSSYSEFYFTETLWPDFGEDEYRKAIEEFGKRGRRFGK